MLLSKFLSRVPSHWVNHSSFHFPWWIRFHQSLIENNIVHMTAYYHCSVKIWQRVKHLPELWWISIFFILKCFKETIFQLPDCKHKCILNLQPQWSKCMGDFCFFFIGGSWIGYHHYWNFCFWNFLVLRRQNHIGHVLNAKPVKHAKIFSEFLVFELFTWWKILQSDFLFPSICLERMTSHHYCQFP